MISAALLQGGDGPRIVGLQFGLLNPAQVRRSSVVPITSVALYAKNKPVPGGMNCPRMGTCDRKIVCATCRQDIIKCPGHHGHLDLAAPMYHIGMINIVMKMLRCVCAACSSLLVDIDEFDERVSGVDGRERLTVMGNLCKNRSTCPGCGSPQPKYVYNRYTTSISIDTTGLKFESEEEERAMNAPFTAARARLILSHISDRHARLLGSCPKIARPEWLILTVMQIPPPISRPCIRATDGSRSRGQDDVTVKLVEIYRANKTLDDALRAAGLRSGFMPSDEEDEPWASPESSESPDAVTAASDSLQQHLVQFFHHGAPVGGDARGGGTRGRANGRALRLIPDRMRGKKGRFRGNLGGKRVDFSSRTVASPAPDYDVDEVGIPSCVANHQTFPERVTRFNVDMLTKCVRLGAGVPGGATSVTVPGSDPVDLSLCTTRDAIVLQDGWVVNRHLIDGDWVLVNRQPSLHRMSIMAHRVRIIPDKTFRLPVCDTTPYNADFDGDELNVHILQTHDARTEAEQLMSVSTQMINPENNKPIVALVQDSLVSAYLMSSGGTFLERHQAMQLIMDLRYLPRGDYHLPPPAIVKPRALWTGKQLISLLFPVTLAYSAVVRDGEGGVMDADERTVRVNRGELLCGGLCKKTLGTSAGGMVHVLVRDWGYTTASRFVSDAQRMLRNFTMIYGFSVGVGDCLMPTSSHARVNSMIETTLRMTDEIIGDARHARGAVVDRCVTKLLGGLLTRGGGEVVKDVNVRSGNRVCTMIESGAKGSAVNISQILSCVGQQSVEGGRVRLGVNQRTLPCFRRGDNSAGARGFVCNSYGTGLTAQEYFFHAMGGREGLVDTAVKTASTGYIQRRLSKAQEGLQVHFDNTVRNSSGDIIQLYYGGDSYYPTHLECVRYPVYSLSDRELRESVVGSRDEWEFTGAPDTWMAHALKQFAAIRTDRDRVRLSQRALHDSPIGSMVMPCRPDRLMRHAACTPRGPPPCAEDVVRAVDTLIARVGRTRRQDATEYTVAYLRAHLTLRALVYRSRLDMDGVQWVCNKVWEQCNGALAEPGEMVGTVGASSIGAPCTQMTLNTFHTAGVLAHTVTQGVPRLRELIDMSTSIRTPSLRVGFTPQYSTHEHMARTIAAGIECTMLNQAVASSAVVDAREGDEEMVDLHTSLMNPGEMDACGPWALRFVLDRGEMVRKQLDVGHAGRALATYMGDNGVVMWSEVNSLEWVVRVMVVGMETERVSLYLLHDFLLDNVAVHGVLGISRVLVRSVGVQHVEQDTGAVGDVARWIADTEGSGLLNVLGLPGVDPYSTHSNDIHETLEVLGIEAAAHRLLTEIRAVLSHDGAYVNDRHLQLLVDVMTHGGGLSPVTRHSMTKLGASVYTRASFEQTQVVLTWAAAMGTRNSTNGVTENIMIGNPISGGTGCIDVITDPAAMPRATKTRVVAPLVMERSAPVAPLNPRVNKRRGVKPMAPFPKRARSTMPPPPPRDLKLGSPHHETFVREFALASPKISS